MRQLPIEQQVLLLMQIVALVTLCVRLWRDGLNRIYPYFFIYLLMTLVQSLIPVVVPVQSFMYRDLFVASQGLIIAFEAMVVLELYSVVLGDLQGIARTAARYVRISLVLAIFAAVLILRLERNTATLTGYVFAFERTVTTSLLVFVLLITAFLVYYPVPLGKNVIAYMVGYAVLFVVTTTITFIQDLGYYWVRLLGSIDMAVFACCLLFWLFMLTRQGEKKRMVVGHQWSHGDEGRLIAQLEAINASLLRSARK